VITVEEFVRIANLCSLLLEMCRCPCVVDSQFSTNKLGQRHRMELLCLTFTCFRKIDRRMAGFASDGESEGEADDGD
jgi:hypothetical protein